jgi:tetratricopeptide (TPR) repeat protein
MKSPQNDVATFGELLLRYRSALGLPQEDLAGAAAMSVYALGGRGPAAPHSAVALAGGEWEELPPVGFHATASSRVPPALPDLVGGEHARFRVDDQLTVVTGEPGVGKTTLAVAVANRLRPEFPDGCFLVDLRGTDDRPTTARAALERLLRALGVPISWIPASEADREALYRTMLTRRKVLVLLDDAADEAQVRPLVTATPGCLTLVTSRHSLDGLATARRLDPLDDADAVELLAGVAGPRRVHAEPVAARELVALCGNLPLAVRIAGSWLLARPHWSVAGLAARLHRGHVGMRAVLELSYDRLSEGTRLLLRRVAALPGVDFGAALARAAAGRTDGLDELADAGLLQRTPAPGRYQCHAMVRDFATENRTDEDEKAAHAVLDHLLATATAAGRAVVPESGDDTADWLVREEPNWVAALGQAAHLGRHREVVDLAKALHRYAETRWTGPPWTEIFGLGVSAAHALGDRRDEARLLNLLGWSQLVCDADPDAALGTHRRALAVADDRLEQAWAHAHIASVLRRQDRLDDALDHIRQASALAREFDFWVAQVPVRNRLGRIFQALGRWDEAFIVHSVLLADTLTRGGEVCEERRRWQATLTRVEVGRCLFAKGEWRRAAEAFRETREVLAAMGAAGQDADAALNEGEAWLAAGEQGPARECLRYALDAYGDAAPAGRRDQALAALARLPPG